MGLLVEEIALLSCPQAEIYTILNLLPVDGRHVRLTSSPDVRHIFHLLLERGSMGLVVGISLLSCIQAETYVIVYVLPVSGGHL